MPDIVEMLKIIDVISKIVLGFVGAFITYLLYKNNRAQRSDNWLKHFNELHDLFWKDPDMREVRSWIACNESYLEVEKIFKKRRNCEFQADGAAVVSPVEYLVLEKLDKFCNLMVRVITLNPDTDIQKKMWKGLFFFYWVDKIRDENRRPDMYWYVSSFYPELVEHGK